MTISAADLISRRHAILAHPRFAEARALTIDGYLALYSHRPALNKLLLDGNRHVVVMFAICLAAQQKADDPETWLTIGRLQDVVVAHQAGSPGLVEAVMGRLLDSGLFEAVPAPGDRRKKLLQPTETLLAHDRDMLAAQIAPCGLLGDTPGIALAVAQDPAFQKAHRIVAVAGFGEARMMMMSHPEVMTFFNRDSGYLVLISLLKAALASPEKLVATESYQETADRFGISRTHVSNLVADGEALGLMKPETRGGTTVELAAELVRAHDIYLADCMVLIEKTCATAAALLAETS